MTFSLDSRRKFRTNFTSPSQCTQMGRNFSTSRKANQRTRSTVSIALLWIIFGHRSFSPWGVATTNANELFDWLETVPSAFAGSFHIWVNTSGRLAGDAVIPECIGHVRILNLQFPKLTQYLFLVRRSTFPECTSIDTFATRPS